MQMCEVNAVTAAGGRPVAVVGAGLTGLSAAWYLAKRGVSVVVFEGSHTVGGVIASERHPDGWLVEAGPNSLQETAVVAELVRALGLESRRILASPAAKNRYIWRNGALRALPLSPLAFLRSSLFSWQTKFRVVKEYFRSPYPRRDEDVSLAEFITDHFGPELRDYALDPFVSGIYAGDPARLSARHAFPALWRAEQEYGSLVKAQILSAREKRRRGERRGPPPIISFDDGLGVLPAALAASLPAGSVRLGAPVQRLQGSRAEGWRLDAAPGELFAEVVLALPAADLARLEIGKPGLVTTLTSLKTLVHPPVVSLFLGYRREDVAHPLDGFGLLLPSVEKRNVLGVLFSSTLFPGRAPRGCVALTVMIGGLRRPDLATMDTASQFTLARSELAHLLGVRGVPLFTRRHLWPQAIPQYQIGHDSHLQALRSVEHRHPGVHIGGPLCDGIGLPACIAAGQRLAEAALAGIATRV